MCRRLRCEIGCHRYRVVVRFKPSIATRSLLRYARVVVWGMLLCQGRRRSTRTRRLMVWRISRRILRSLNGLYSTCNLRLLSLLNLGRLPLRKRADLRVWQLARSDPYS